MRVFVTGASGHIGSAVVPELLRGGHEVVGLARSETSAAAVKALGAEVRRGDTGDLDVLRAAAADADAVVHLAFNHDQIMTDFAGAAAADLAAVRAFGDALAGTGKTLMGVGLGEAPNETVAANPRFAVARELAELARRDIRVLLMGIPQVVHSPRDSRGFIPMLIAIARGAGVSGYVGDGANRWPAVHTLDLARLYRLALEKAPAGSQLPAAAEEGVPVREIAAAIGRHLGVPAASIPAERAADHFGGFAAFIGYDNPMSNAGTRQLTGWAPEHSGLIADIDEGHYFTAG
ncbi:MAG TPA: SDR family oxidoreductase [Trebonia sp.]|nr:SDR family oxidoreductase [Trebonia sp.]